MEKEDITQLIGMIGYLLIKNYLTQIQQISVNIILNKLDDNIHWKTLQGYLQTFRSDTGLPESFAATFAGINSNAKEVFLNNISESIDDPKDPNTLTQKQFDNLNSVLFTDKLNYNADVLFIWYKINLKFKQLTNLEKIKAFLLTYGRGKYVEPLFIAWYDIQPKEAKEFYEKLAK